eukprot:COSAG06_NODE_146_length_22145_cov_11.714733_19_plen_88_part_00
MAKRCVFRTIICGVLARRRREEVAAVGTLTVGAAVHSLECNVEPEVLAGVSVLDALHRLHRVLLSRADVRTQRSGGLEILFKALGFE